MRWWQQLLALQFSFSILFVPLGILIFNQFNPAALLANIVAIPLVSFAVLPLVLVGCLMSVAGSGLSHMLFKLADSLLVFLLDYLDWLLNSGLHSIAVTYPAPLIAITLVAMLILLFPRMSGMRKVAMTTLVVAGLWQPPRLNHGAYELTILDVGMGTSVLLRTRNHNLVYDLGPGKAETLNAVDWALIPVMLRYGIQKPDLLVVSHVDQDHSGGMHSFGGNYQISSLLSGTPRELESRFKIRRPLRSCHAYPDWRWDGVDFSFLTAGSQSAGTSSNNRSCVLAINGTHRALIPGDIESSREMELLSKYRATLDADILLAPHHGSKTSSSMPFVSRVKPEHVVFTQARKNRWGFPVDEVVARYDAVNARQYRSDKDGAIIMQSSDQGLIIKATRRPIRRIWQRW
ncbi:MAG: DNA internalization-related competence protein ComEC/Rec2 [Gammaproteobacteria bacterium]|nr:DNA internalization-related competence protein ComEC/Rec2 [Gammaproteobacteria bacterium]